MFMALRSQKSENRNQIAETSPQRSYCMIARYRFESRADVRGRDIKMRDHSHGFVIDADSEYVLFL